MEKDKPNNTQIQPTPTSPIQSDSSNNDWQENSPNNQPLGTNAQLTNTIDTQNESNMSATTTSSISPNTGIFAEGASPIQQPTNNITQKKSKTTLIVTIVLLIIALVVGGFFLIRSPMNSGTKTISEFESIVSKLNYRKAENPDLEYSDSSGAFVTYYKSKETAADGLVMFYVMESKEALRELVKQEGGDIANEAMASFDWSKTRNESYECTTNKQNVHICIDIIQLENTMLMIYYHSNSSSEAESEVKDVVTAMGYQE